ncbi:hypothetical protein NL676_014263 [Syzygium grande]|nr:hypothetical protein NL676_014263 [Syzygium grande]
MVPAPPAIAPVPAPPQPTTLALVPRARLILAATQALPGPCAPITSPTAGRVRRPPGGEPVLASSFAASNRPRPQQ